MKKIKLFFAILLFAATYANAQNEMDAFRYSFFNYGGTARFMSMGGAFGALGGDISSLAINPAGIGIYRGSEFTITPSLNYSNVGSNYYGTSYDDIKYSFNMKNVGFVFTIPLQGGIEEPGMKSVNIGIGLVQHNNFNYRSVAEGFNDENSLMTHFLNEANEFGLKPFTTNLAYEAWLLGTENGNYFVDMPDGNVFQRMENNTSGYIQELLFSFGGNYNDVAYFGATVGVPSVRFEESFMMEESDTEGLSDEFNSLQYNQSLKTTGRGYNFKIGALFRIADVVRLGAAVHTPTFFQLEDSYKNTMYSNLNFDDYPSKAESPRGYFDYELNTPLKALGSLAVVMGNMGLISVDYEYLDYSSMRLRSETEHFSTPNRNIRDSFQEQHGIRVGGELNFAQIFAPVFLRGGYALYTSPYKHNNNFERSVFSAGLGLRDKDYFIDFAYVYNAFDEDFYPYTNVAELPKADLNYTQSSFILTLGLRW